MDLSDPLLHAPPLILSITTTPLSPHQTTTVIIIIIVTSSPSSPLSSPRLSRCKTSTKDGTNADSNATLEPMYVEDSQADALPTIAPAEAPHSRNHIKSPRTQNTSTEDVPSDRGSKGVSEGRDAAINELMGDKIGKELLHFDPSPYYMQYPYDEGLSSNPPNPKKGLFKDLKVCNTILDRVLTPT
ncbi:hypothetical protein Tco_0051171 [Tanacetum coccineum]